MMRVLETIGFGSTAAGRRDGAASMTFYSGDSILTVFRRGGREQAMLLPLYMRGDEAARDAA